MNPPEPLPGQPRDGSGAPVFAAPWQARAFALTVHLHDRGAFAWADWSAALARACATRGADADGYYTAWVAALDDVLAARGIASPEAVAAMAAAWTRAAAATPHGDPILLENDRAR